MLKKVCDNLISSADGKKFPALASCHQMEHILIKYNILSEFGDLQLLF